MKNIILSLFTIAISLGSFAQNQINNTAEYNKANSSYNLGIEYLNKENYKLAIAEFNQAIKYDSTYIESFYARGYTKKLLEDYRGSIQDFDIYLNNEPTSKVFYARGHSKFVLKRFAAALQDFKSAISLDPEDSQSYLMLGLTYNILGNKELGCINLSKAGELGDMEAYDIIAKYCNPK